MDRLSALILLAALPVLVGCDDGASAGPAPPGRVVAVAARPDDTSEELCDVAPRGPDAPRLELPALAEGSSETTARGRRWVNVWATWCRPCVEEMPLLAQWKDRLAGDGVDVELVFLSADADAEALATYREAHPSAQRSLQIADPTSLPAWARTVGLDEGATLPIHVLTDADGRVRCARTGALHESDYLAIRRVLSR
jgi:thiol-disulfide isomerase/thioredoxin